MSVIVIDTETTGIDETDVIQLAWLPCLELQPLLDFQLTPPQLHASCTPEEIGATVPCGTQTADAKEKNDLGRLGLEPRTNTLKADCFHSQIRLLRARK